MEYILEARGISKSFDRTRVLDDVSFAVKDREIFFVLGPSGCGKTTLLRVLSGFCSPDRGAILLGGTDITNHAPSTRNIGLVFQNYALWPHLSVRENIAYGLKVKRLPSRVIEERIEKMLSVTEMAEFKERFPGQLSGGQQQRVALARALIVEPKILLLDEPLSNLDAKLREQMREEIKRIQRATGITMIYVTHDQQEALALGDRGAVMERGAIVQTDTPATLYARPARKSVAAFLGRMNFLPATVRMKQDQWLIVETAEGIFRAPVRPDVAASDRIEIGFRPEHVRTGEREHNTVQGIVTDTEYGGDHTRVRIRTSRGSVLEYSIPSGDTGIPGHGTTVTVSVVPESIIVFRNSDGGK